MRVLCVMIVAAAATPAVHGAVFEISFYNDTNCTTENGSRFAKKYNATCELLEMYFGNFGCTDQGNASYHVDCKEDDWEEPISVSRIDFCFLNETCHTGLNEHALNEVEERNITLTLYEEETNIPILRDFYGETYGKVEFLYNITVGDLVSYPTITAYDKFCIYADVPFTCPANPKTALCEENDNSTLYYDLLKNHNFRATCRELSPATPSFTPTLTQTLTQTSTPTSTQSLTQTSTPTSTQSSTPTSTYTTSTSTTSTTTTTTVFEKSRRVHMFVPIVATGGFVLAFVGSALA